MADEEDEAAMARTDEAEALTVLPADQGLERAPEEVEEEAQLQSLEAAQPEDCEGQAEAEQGPDSEAEASQAILLQSVGVTYGDGTEVSEVDAPADFATGMVEGLSELERLALEAQGTNTIIYVQPDGTLVEGEGLTAEEQQQIVEQLTKQQGLVEIVDGDAAARLFEEHQQHQLQLQQQQQQEDDDDDDDDDQQQAEEQFVHHVGLGPEELQQVIEHVTKSQAAAAAAAAAAQNPQQENKSELASVTVQAADITSGQPHIIHIPMGQLQGAGQTFQLVSHPQRVSMSKDLSPVSSTIFGQPITIVANATQHLQNAAQVILQQSQKLDAEVTTTVSPPPPPPPPPPPSAVKGGDSVALCVKSPGEKDRSMQTLTTVAPKTIAQVQTLGLTGQVPSGSQIIQLQPVGQGQPQQFILCGAGGSPTTIRVVSQRQAQSLGSVSTVRLVSGVNGQRAARDSSIEGKEARAKKALKIKTRSGRISRPPLHKIKDYKFIKMEDLADGHQSDSDDYSEYSVEEEEESSGKEDKLGGTGHMSYTSKPKNFRCQNCDKSYIGRGGLARHYRLNPTHGALEALPEEVANGAGGSAEVTESLESLEPPVDEVIKVSAPVATESQDPEVIVTSTFASCDKPRGFQKARRVGRPAKNTFHEQKRRARMKELLKQCDDDDLVELVFPRLIQVFSLWEILLMKVEYAGGSGLQFPAVYREFESLHGHVRTLAAEHLRSPAATQEPLQVNNPQVAETLGMLSGLVGEPNYDRTAPCKLVFVTASSQNAQKRALEAANKGTSGEPPRKRLRPDLAPCPPTGKPVAPSTSSASQTPCSPLPGVAASSSVTEAAGPSSPDVQLVSESSSQLVSESTGRLQGGTSVDCENIQLQVSPHMVSIGRQSPDVFVIEPETTSGSAQAADENTVNGAWAGCVENEAEAKTAEAEVVNGSATAPESTLDPENSHIEVPGFGDDTLIQGAEGIDGPSSGETSMIEPSHPPDSGVPDCADSVDHTAMDIQTPSFGDEALADDVATRCLDLSSEAPQEDGEGGDCDQSQIQEPIILAEVPKQLGAIGDSVTVANGAAISEGLTVHTHHRVLLQTRDGLLIPHPNPEEFVSGHGGADVVIVAEGGVGGAHGVPLETVQALLSMEASLGGTGSGQ